MAHASSWREHLHHVADGFGGGGGFGNGNGNGQTDDGGTITQDPPADYPAGGDPGGDGAPPQDDPWAGEVPEAMREEFGGQTWAEVRDQLNQTRQSAAMVEAQRELIDVLMGDRHAQAPAAAAAPQAPAAPAPFDWYGFGSKEAYVAAYQNNPQIAEQRRSEWAVQQALEKLKGQMPAAAAPAKDPEVERMKGFYRKQTAESRTQDLANRYEAARQPGLWSETGPIAKWAAGNKWIHDLNEAYPDVNAQAIAFKLWHYDQLTKANKAQSVRMAETRAASGVGRPGVTGRNVQPQAPKTHYEAGLAALNRYRAAGGVVTEGMKRQVENLRNGPGGTMQPRISNIVG